MTIAIVIQDIKDLDQDLMEEDIKDITIVIAILKETQGTRIDVPEEARIIEAQEIITTGFEFLNFNL